MSRYTLPMKLALTFFVLFLWCGLASSIALYHNQFAFSAEQAAQYYRGNAERPDPEVIMVQTSYRRLLEVTHFHLYITPIVYLALTHLYFLSSRPRREKSAVACLTFLSLMAEVATPWLVRYLSGGWSRMFWISGPGITVFTLWMGGICLWELWVPPNDESTPL